MLAEAPEATIFRPSIIFGPEDDFFNRLAAMAQISPFLPLIGGGHTLFQPVFVGDVAHAIAKAAAGDTKAGTTYELGGREVRTFKELIEFVLEALRQRRLLVPIPFALAELQASVLQFLPQPGQITRKRPNCCITVIDASDHKPQSLSRSGAYRSDVEAHTMQQCAAHIPPMTLPSVVRIAEQGML